MALTTNVTDKVELPHEPGEHVMIRMLSWRQLEDARRERSRAAMTAMDGVDTELLKGVLADLPDTKEERDEIVTSTEYDRGALLRFGITSWSYDEEVTHDTIDDLDEVTSEFVATAIENLSVKSNDAGKDFGTS